MKEITGLMTLAALINRYALFLMQKVTQDLQDLQALAMDDILQMRLPKLWDSFWDQVLQGLVS